MGTWFRSGILVVAFWAAGCGDVVADALHESGNMDTTEFSTSDSGAINSASDSVTDSGVPVDTNVACAGQTYDAEGDLVFDEVDSGGWIVTGWKIWRNGYLEGSHVFTGEDRVQVTVYGQPAGTTWPHMSVWINGVLVGDEMVEVSEWTAFEYVIPASYGAGTVRVELDNDVTTATEDVNLVLQSVVLFCP